jgi:hypothetical protein
MAGFGRIGMAYFDGALSGTGGLGPQRYGMAWQAWLVKARSDSFGFGPLWQAWLVAPRWFISGFGGFGLGQAGTMCYGNEVFVVVPFALMGLGRPGRVGFDKFSSGWNGKVSLAPLAFGWVSNAEARSDVAGWAGHGVFGRDQSSVGCVMQWLARFARAEVSCDKSFRGMASDGMAGVARYV